MGFEDFYDFDIIKQQREMHLISMEEFLESEAKHGGLHGIYPPGNSSNIRAGKLWKYLHDVADVTPKWGGRMVAFPENAGDFNLKSGKHVSEELQNKMKKFGGGRSTVYYEEELINAHHIHFSAGPGYRVLQHHYGTYSCLYVSYICIILYNI